MVLKAEPTNLDFCIQHSYLSTVKEKYFLKKQKMRGVFNRKPALQEMQKVFFREKTTYTSQKFRSIIAFLLRKVLPNVRVGVQVLNSWLKGWRLQGFQVSPGHPKSVRGPEGTLENRTHPPSQAVYRGPYQNPRPLEARCQFLLEIAYSQCPLVFRGCFLGWLKHVGHLQPGAGALG